MTTEVQVRANIARVLKERKLNANNLCGGDLALSKKIYNQLYKDKTLTFDVIAVLLNAVPDLNAEWLFRGIGTPYKDMTSPEQRLIDIEERLSALEGEREKPLSDSQQHTA